MRTVAPRCSCCSSLLLLLLPLPPLFLLILLYCESAVHVVAVQPIDGAHIGADGMIHAKGHMAEHGEMFSALSYACHLEWGKGCHSGRHIMSVLPDAVRWLFDTPANPEGARL